VVEKILTHLGLDPQPPPGHHQHLAQALRLRCQRQPGWPCAACRLDVQGFSVNPDSTAQRTPSDASGAGRITTKRRRSRHFQAIQVGIGQPPKRLSGSPETV
jgi:hypothetical protein